MKLISLTQGQFAQIDDEYFDEISEFKWFAFKSSRTWYAARNVRVRPGYGGQARLTMHCALMPGHELIDHIDLNGLNNQRYNIRPATKGQNKKNSAKISKPKTSRFKGVCWHKTHKKWVAQARDQQSKIARLGEFTDEVEAAKAYDRYATEHYGEFARINFPDQVIVVSID